MWDLILFLSTSSYVVYQVLCGLGLAVKLSSNRFLHYFPFLFSFLFLFCYSKQWWPGGLGKVATHAIVYARLIVSGQDHGVHGKG